MQYISKYKSPIGNILISANDDGLFGLWFEEQRYFGAGLNKNPIEKETDIIKETKLWLDTYFSGIKPDFHIQLCFSGTDFQKTVWETLCNIPYGKTVTYGEIANLLAVKKGIKKMSARAVGNAVGKNKISIIVPCHRVLGANGKLTGYAGGLEKKEKLLKIEKAL